MILYDQQHAPNPRRVRIFMAEKGIVCERIQVNIVAGENLTDAFLQLNPRGLLPTLVLDDGTVLTESVAICRYLEELYPKPNLMGTNPVKKAQIEAANRFVESAGMLPVAEVFRNSYPKFRNRAIGGNVGSVAALPQLVERGRLQVSNFFEHLNGMLVETDYLGSDEFSIADISALCTIDFATTAARIAFPSEHANISRWHDTISQRPSIRA